MKIEEVKGLFALAGIPVLNIKPLPDGYGYSPDDPRYYETPPRCAWWFVKTAAGWVEVGWRKRVININWEDTPVRKVITADDVTKSETTVHAWDTSKALEYLTALKLEMSNDQAQAQPPTATPERNQKKQ